ncbi:lipid-A-disaccharide synthase [Candidatus Puniceispirillum sp.]|nr:lipid-A-disaccharide synthase [Candidatus Puniceispirillum sp.]
MTAPIFILAGEPSGDRLASHIMQAVNKRYNNPGWIGVGGVLMQNEGLNSLIDMETLSIMGFGNALISYRSLSALADKLVEQVISAKPRIVLTIDNKEFSVRLATRIRRRMKAVGWSAPIIHCVAPTVWAWGSWRAKKFVSAMDGLLCLFPFEPDHFRSLGLNAHFIGHPEAFENYVHKRSIKKKPPYSRQIALLPGSRRTEVKLILPEMLTAAAILKRHDPNFTFVLPAVPHLLPMIKAYTEGHEIDVTECPSDIIAILQSSEAMIATSGTVTLQAALCGTVGVTCYKTGAFSAFVGRQLVDLDQVILPNVILGRRLYDFYFQKQANAKVLASAILDIFDNKDVKERARKAAIELKTLLTGDCDKFERLLVTAIKEWLGPPNTSIKRLK